MTRAEYDAGIVDCLAKLLVAEYLKRNTPDAWGDAAGLKTKNPESRRATATPGGDGMRVEAATNDQHTAETTDIHRPTR